MEITESPWELSLLESIEKDPDVTQANLAEHLGIAVGTVNWHLKRLISKGYVKVKRAQRRKLRYIITPEGIALRTRLTVKYVEANFSLYRRTRQRVSSLLMDLKEEGYEQVRVVVTEQDLSDILDVCKLTCLENQIQIVDNAHIPVLRIEGLDVALEMPDGVVNV